MIPSKYQKAFFEKIEKGSERKIVLRAVPGSGKTTTLIEGSKRVNTKSKIFLAYSKSVVAELIPILCKDALNK
jgi:DNA helicase II / ATP-dependent DNA helicase PcrA